MKPASSPKLLLLPSLVFLHFLVSSTAQKQVYKLCVVANGNFTAGSPYETNRNHLLSSLYTNTSIDYGFYNSTYGETPNQVYAIAQCRPDMDPSSCRDCIQMASQDLTENCTSTYEAIGGYDDGGYKYCMLRYANRNIFGRMEDAPYFFMDSQANITEDVAGFKTARQDLLDRLPSQAAAGDSRNKSASGEEPVADMTIFAYVQCTPDLTESDCNHCLNNATARLPQCCDAYRGGRVIYPSCNFRYEINPILKTQVAPSPSSPADRPPPPPPPPPPGKTVIIIVCVSVAVLVMLVISICIYLRTRKPKDEYKRADKISDAESLQFEFGTIRAATNGFSDANKLGQGGFGTVFRVKKLEILEMT